MRSRVFRILVFLLGILAAAAPGTGEAEEGEIPISLDTAVRTAIERNLGLTVATFDPAIAQTGILRAGGIYNPTLGALFDYRRDDYRLFPDNPTVVRTHYFDADVSLNQLLSTGATATMAFTNQFFNDSLEGPDSRFARPILSFSLSQPLLAGFGREVTERGITVASDVKEAALAAWRDAALGAAAGARDAYFAVIRAREDLLTREASLAVAKQIQAENEARVRAGVLASIELLDSEFGLAERERDLLEARKNVLEQADRLRVFLQYPDPGTLSPVSTFPEERIETTEESAIETAFRNRPDLLAARISLRTFEFQVKVARNLVLPSLAATGSAGVKGLGKNYGDATSDMTSGDVPFWSVGLSFSYPIGNDAARADLAEATLRARQAQTRIRELEASIGLDVRSAIRDMETKYREIGVAEKGVALGEARLASFLKRGKLGLATTKNILEVEADYVAARDALTAARTDYQGAVTQFYRSTGELLDQYGIRLSDKEIEAMTRKNGQ